MNKELIKEIEGIIKSEKLNCSVKEFKNNVDWAYISINQKLSEPFIREFKDKVAWGWISEYQKLSEPFIREFKDNVDWICISKCQKLSEPFIREFKDKVDWELIKQYWFINYYMSKGENHLWAVKNKVYWELFKSQMSTDNIKKINSDIGLKHSLKESTKQNILNQIGNFEYLLNN